MTYLNFARASYLKLITCCMALFVALSLRADGEGEEGSVEQPAEEQQVSIGINFNATNNRQDTSAALVPNGQWIQTTGEAGINDLRRVGAGFLTWSANGTYQWDDMTAGFMKGYLDDAANTTVNIAVTDIPYATYDLYIYCNTDTANWKWAKKTVNGTQYTWDEATQSAIVTNGDGVAKWGQTRVTTPQLGTNVLKIVDLSGDLTIVSHRPTNEDSSRATIAAIQIVKKTDFSTQVLSENKKTSELQEMMDTTNRIFEVSNNVEITIDSVLSNTVYLVSTNNNAKITFKKNGDDGAIPTAEQLSKINICGVEGQVEYDWLTTNSLPTSIGYNFNSQKGNSTKTALLSGGLWCHNAANERGRDRNILSNSLMGISWYSNTLWNFDETSILSGYLDDGDTGAEIIVWGIPYSEYDVLIYCGSDQGTTEKCLLPKLVNGKTYTMPENATVAIEGTNIWGYSQRSIIELGINVMRVNGLTGTLTINGGVRDSAKRGIISAIQILPKDAPLDDLPILTPGEGVTELKWSESTNKWTNSTLPESPNKVKINLSTNLTLTIDQNVAVGSLEITGGALTIVTEEGSTFSTSGITLDNNATFVVCSNTFANATVNVPISGSGRVVAQGGGEITFSVASTFTGGTTVKTGTTVKLGHWKCLGPENSSVTVENGACVDLNGSPAHYRYTIAGKGIATTNGEVTTYSGAIKCSKQGDISNGTGQTRGITLTGDALIDATCNWGFLAQSYAETAINFNNYTLTKQGSGTFFACNVTASNGGTFIVKEGTLQVLHRDCRFATTRMVFENASILHLSGKKLLTCGGLIFRPSATQSPVLNGRNNLAEAISPVVDAGLLCPDDCKTGTITLVRTTQTGDNNKFTNNFFTASLGSAFEGELTVADQSVTTIARKATVPNFLHLDFDDGCASQDDAKADDSTCGVDNWHGVSNPEKGRSPSNYAAKLCGDDATKFQAWWNNYTNLNRSPFASGAMTVTAVLKPILTDKRVIYSLGSGHADSVVLAIDDANTISLVARYGGSVVKKLATVTNIPNLTTHYHFVAAIFTGKGTTLIVDELPPVTTDIIAPYINQNGQLGNTHGANFDGYQASGNGSCYLDDFQVYDAWLTDEEISIIRRKYRPFGVQIYFR